jgi:phosphomannomutase/phosphoglucomutase
MTGPEPRPEVTQNTPEFLREAMIAPTGFREYDARWRFPDEINLPGITALGLGLGTQMHAAGVAPEIVVGHDYRDYSLSVKNALVLGLIQAGITVRDIGVSLSPMAYFAQFHLDVPAVAMVTASHNPNGWTGVKMGFERPLTHGPDEMAQLRDIVLGGKGMARSGGSVAREDGVRTALDSVLTQGPFTSPEDFARRAGLVGDRGDLQQRPGQPLAQHVELAEHDDLVVRP